MKKNDVKFIPPKEKKFYPNISGQVSFNFNFGWYKGENFKMLKVIFFEKEEGKYITIFNLSFLKFDIALAILY